MNEQRTEAYLNLINQLLGCPSGEETEILNANVDLIDAGLVQMMEQVAKVLAERGDENAAEYLRNVARQLAEVMGFNSPNPPAEFPTREGEEVNFLLQVLQATEESNGNPEVVYPLLQANLNLLNDNFAQVLRYWAEATLPEVEADVAQGIAAIIVNFSNLIQQFPLGSRTSNLEIAIAGYEALLTGFTRDTYPEAWATLQNNLGNAYRDRIRGDKAENIEQAIAAYSAALQVNTREAFPIDWAMAQNNLGIAYRNRIRGDKAENIEQA
nr:tetratricopeptide repeat protein [Aphanothece sp. CMT-3BRIN-NPC111]